MMRQVFADEIKLHAHQARMGIDSLKRRRYGATALKLAILPRLGGFLLAS
jgi:hypothetical protein